MSEEGPLSEGDDATFGTSPLPGEVPGGRMLTRAQLAEAAGCGETSIRRLEERNRLVPTIGPRGVHLFPESAATEVTLQIARRVKFRAQSPDAFDGVMAANVFQLLDDGVQRVDIVKRLQMEPRAVEAIFAAWARLKGGFVVEESDAALIEALPWLRGTFPLQGGSHLLASLTASVPTACGRCHTASPSVCAACARAMNAKEAARVAFEERDRTAQRDHERQMAAMTREVDRRRKDIG